MKPHEQAPESTPIQKPEEHLTFDQIDAGNAAMDARLRALEQKWGLPSPTSEAVQTPEDQVSPDLAARGITPPQARTASEARRVRGNDHRLTGKRLGDSSPTDALFEPTADESAQSAQARRGALPYEDVLLLGSGTAVQPKPEGAEPAESVEKPKTPLERFVALSDEADYTTADGKLESTKLNKTLTGQEAATPEDARTAAVEAVVATGVQYEETRRGFMLTGSDGKKHKISSLNRSPVEIIKAAEQVLREDRPDAFATPPAVYGFAMDHVANEKGNRITRSIRNLLRRGVRRSTPVETSMASPDLMRIASAEDSDDEDNAKGKTATRATYMLVNASNEQYYNDIEQDVEYATQQSSDAAEAPRPHPVRVGRADAIIGAGAASREVMKGAKVPLRIAVGAAALLGAAMMFMPQANQSEAPAVSEAQVAVSDQDQLHFSASPIAPDVPQMPVAPTTQPETKSFSVTFDNKSTLWSANNQLLKQAGADASPATVDALNQKMLEETGANEYNLHAGSKVTITVDQNGKVVSSHADLR